MRPEISFKRIATKAKTDLRSIWAGDCTASLKDNGVTPLTLHRAVIHASNPLSIADFSEPTSRVKRKTGRILWKYVCGQSPVATLF